MATALLADVRVPGCVEQHLPAHAFVAFAISAIFLGICMACDVDDKLLWASLILFMCACFYAMFCIPDELDRDVVRDCTLHEEIRDTAYCDGVVYEKGNK